MPPFDQRVSLESHKQLVSHLAPSVLLVEWSQQGPLAKEEPVGGASKRNTVD